MIVMQVVTRNGYNILNLDRVNGIEYNEESAELLFVGENAARSYYLDKGTKAKDVWDTVNMALASAYEPRSMHTHACLLKLDLTKFQSEEARF